MDYSNGTLQQYEENVRLEAEIQTILAQKTNRRGKIFALRQLQSSVSTPLAKSHIAYYINKLKACRLRTFAHILYAFILVPYFIFVIYRTYQMAHPEQYVFTNFFHLTTLQSVYAIFCIPIVIFAFYLIIYLQRRKKW